MRLIQILPIQGKIILKTGLHIGAGDTEMRIGGVDNPVITHPHTRAPYIPGSSLKGKVRALLELKSGLMGVTDGHPVSAKKLKGAPPNLQPEGEKILKIFGSSGADAEEKSEFGPTRISFADCPLSAEWAEQTLSMGLALTEVKSENSINRIKGTAENPRFTERVPSGAEFDFTFSLKEFEGDDGLLDYVLLGLKLLTLDALGGSGSRGYGRIGIRFDDSATQERFDKIDPLEKEG